jgi:hypothetical protein
LPPISLKIRFNTFGSCGRPLFLSYRATRIKPQFREILQKVQLFFGVMCSIPYDSVQYSRWPLFFVREVLQETVDSLKARKEEGGTSFA